MPASAGLAAVSAVAASLFVTTLPARAADLYEPPHHGSAYDDSRYGDNYGDEGPAYERYGEAEEGSEGPYPRRPPYRDYDAFQRGYAEDGCVSRDAERARLRADGWSDFRDPQLRGRVVLLQARRPSGRSFDLTIDKCSGEVIAARPLDGRYDRRFFAGGPRRYWQPY
jgi:hypothetical protein